MGSWAQQLGSVTQAVAVCAVYASTPRAPSADGCRGPGRGWGGGCAQDLVADHFWLTVALFSAVILVLIVLILRSDGPTHQKAQ
jgi:hypothetical protein